ncbi:hypothetical protein Tco_0507726 [Tanacetum coccineum]
MFMTFVVFGSVVLGCVQCTGVGFDKFGLRVLGGLCLGCDVFEVVWDRRLSASSLYETCDYSIGWSNCYHILNISSTIYGGDASGSEYIVMVMFEVDGEWAHSGGLSGMFETEHLEALRGSMCDMVGWVNCYESERVVSGGQYGYGNECVTLVERVISVGLAECVCDWEVGEVRMSMGVSGATGVLVVVVVVRRVVLPRGFRVFRVFIVLGSGGGVHRGGDISLLLVSLLMVIHAVRSEGYQAIMCCRYGLSPLVMICAVIGVRVLSGADMSGVNETGRIDRVTLFEILGILSN